MGWMLILPLFMVHLKQLGVSPSQNGAIESLSGVLQLVSSLLVGRWSDNWGRRPLLLMCLAMSTASYLAMGTSPSLWILVGSRVCSGIFRQSATLCKSVLADVTEAAERTKVLGMFSTAMGVAFFLGPALGGYLGSLEDGFSTTCRLSAVFLLGAWALCFKILPRALPRPPRVVDEEQGGVEAPLGHAEDRPSNASREDTKLTRLINLVHVIEWKTFGNIFLVVLFLTFAGSAQGSSFILVINQMFDASPRAIGYIISFQGAIGALAGVLTGKAAEYYSDSHRFLFHSSLLFTSSLVGLTLSPSVVLTAVMIVPMTVTWVFIQATTSAIVIDRCHPSKIGTVTGLVQSITAVAGMTAPVLTGLLQEVSVQGPGFMASLSAALGTSLAGSMAISRRQ